MDGDVPPSGQSLSLLHKPTAAGVGPPITDQVATQGGSKPTRHLKGKQTQNLISLRKLTPLNDALLF